MQPLVFVVGEPELQEALVGDDDFEVFPKRWGSYGSFLLAAASGEIPMERTIVVLVSDRMPKEGKSFQELLDLIGTLVVVVTFKFDAKTISKTGAVPVIGVPTRNSLREGIGRRLNQFLLPLEGGDVPIPITEIDLTFEEKVELPARGTDWHKTLRAARAAVEEQSKVPEFLAGPLPKTESWDADEPMSPQSVLAPANIKTSEKYDSNVIAVYAPKGGLSRSAIAVLLAQQLAASGQEVCVVDMDPLFRPVVAELMVEEPTVTKVLRASELSPAVIRANLAFSESAGVFALLTPAPLEHNPEIDRLLTPATYRRIIAMLQQDFSTIILDCPLGVSDDLSLVAFHEANAAMLIVDGEERTRDDATKVVALLSRPTNAPQYAGFGITEGRIGVLQVDATLDKGGLSDETIRAALDAVIGDGEGTPEQEPEQEPKLEAELEPATDILPVHEQAAEDSEPESEEESGSGIMQRVFRR